MSRHFRLRKKHRWEDYFDPNEVLLWEAAPDPKARQYYQLFMIMPAIAALWFSSILADVALNEMSRVDASPDFGTILIIAMLLVGFVVQFGLAFMWCFAFAFNRHKFIRYALSNKRAFVETSFTGHLLQTYKIQSEDRISLDQGKLDNVRIKSGKQGNLLGGIGFDDVVNGSDLYALAQKVRNEAANAENPR